MLGATMLTYEEANTLLHYDPSTGLLTWRARAGSGMQQAGSIAGSISKQPRARTAYRVTCVNSRNYHNHRLCWLLHYGMWPVGKIDHKDHDGLNNKIENLRDATSQQNSRNSWLYAVNTSGYPGVRWVRRDRRWEAQIGIGCGKKKYLGSFVRIEDAVAARKAAEARYEYHENHGKG